MNARTRTACRARFGAALLVCLGLATAGCLHHAPLTRGIPGTQAELTQSARPLASPSDKRVALVIGNAAYPTARLRNPTHDAKAIGAKLEALNFEVDLVLDATRDAMKRAIMRFRDRLHETGATGLFYFSGHGLQVDERNYLVPVDANVEGLTEIEFQAVSANEVLASMEAARDGINMVFLDACRDNPFRGVTDIKGAPPRGLALMNAPEGTLLAYATAPGETASDGEGENGVWTAALLEHIADEGLLVEQVLKRAAGEVRKVTSGGQTPWLATNWYADVYLNPSKPASAQELLQLAHTNFEAGDYLSTVTDVEQALASEVGALAPPQRDEADLLRGRAQAQIALLSFEVDPETAMVRVDGSTRHSADGLMELNPGGHRVEVSDDGYRPMRRNVELPPGGREKLDLSLQPMRSATTRAWLPWTLGGVAASALVVSAITWGLSTKSENWLQDRCGPDHQCPDAVDWRAEQSKGHALAVAGDVSLGIGLAAATSAVLLRYWPQLFHRRTEDRVNASLSCGRAGCSAGGLVRF